MLSLNNAVIHAERLGGQPTTKTDDSGMTLGQLVLAAFRDHGEGGMRAIMAGYKAGYVGRRRPMAMAMDRVEAA